MRCLIACEHSAVVRNAFRDQGWDSWSCDLLPCEDGAANHFLCDYREVIGQGWDLVGFHPDCTFLCVSGIHWNDRSRGWTETQNALAFVREFIKLGAQHARYWYIENPIGLIGSRIGLSSQTVQPYQFREDASKRTCLWLYNLPNLQPTRLVPGRKVKYAGRVVERWTNQTDSGQNRLPPQEDRWKKRAKTYPGIAKAMADQWTHYIKHDFSAFW